MEELEMNPAENELEAVKHEEDELLSVSTPDESDESASSSDDKAVTNENQSSYAAVDYGEVEKNDLKELHAIFPHLRDKTSITELDNPLRYAALRDLGLTPKEAYLATSEPIHRYDNRSHLRSSVPRSATSPSDILSRGELEAARELFSGLSDREIQKLYKKVSR